MTSMFLVPLFHCSISHFPISLFHCFVRGAVGRPEKFFGVEALHNVWQATAPSQTARPPASALIVHRHSDRPGPPTSRKRTSIAKYLDIEEFPREATNPKLKEIER